MAPPPDAAATSPACDVVLEIWRAREADKATPSPDLCFEPQDYVRRKPDGSILTGTFAWGQVLLDDLAALQRPTMDRLAAEQVAGKLSDLLASLGFADDERRIHAALAAGQPVHLTLRFAAAELHTLPWEMVRFGPEPLGALPGCLIRYEWPGSSTAAPSHDPPEEGGRIVFAYSTRGGEVPWTEQLRAIRLACWEGHHPFDEARDVVPDVSVGRLRASLDVSPVAVLHVLCHGGRVVSRRDGYGLVWDDDEAPDEANVVDAATLRELLAKHLGSLRLVVLCACHGDDGGQLDNRLGSVAQELHRAGIPAVVASRYPLGARAANDLTEALHRALLVETRSLEGAVLAARERLRERPQRVDWASLQFLARAADGADHRPLVFCPYLGLLAFEGKHARWFFGREAEVVEIMSALARLNAEKKPRFLVVTGASGTGKSSLVFAGVVPALQERDGGRWKVVRLRPSDGLPKIDAALAEEERRLLFVVDQLEEIFTDVDEGPTREALARRLWELAAEDGSDVSVIVTLRVDYLGRCGEIALDGDRYLEGVAYQKGVHSVFVERMTRTALEAIIARPAAQVGIALEEGLVTQMLADAGHEPGALPLVEYTLDQMWLARAREGEQYGLTLRAYHDLGGVTGALAKKADGLLAGLDDARRRAARRLLVQLVDTRSEATLDTRRRVRRDKLRRGPAPEAAVLDEVLDALAHERLLVVSEEVGGGVVEIAHEELVRRWRTLRGWLEEDRTRLVELEPLRAWMEAAKGSASYVLSGDQLGRARALLVKYGSEIDAVERALIERSQAAERKTARARQVIATMVATTAVIALALAVVAYRQRNEARRATRMASARELVARGQVGVASMVLAEVEHPEETRGWADLARGLVSREIPKLVLPQRDTASFLAWSPDGKRLVTALQDGSAQIWNADGTGEPIPLEGHARPSKGHAGPSNRRGTIPTFAAFSRDGKRIVTSSMDGTASVWSADGAGAPVVLTAEKPGARISQAAWSPDGARIVTFGFAAQVRVQDADDAREPISLGKSAYSAAWSPDGKRIVITPVEGDPQVWNADGTGEPISLRGHEKLVVSAAWSPDGKQIVTASYDETARVWSADGVGDPIVLRGHGIWLLSATWSPNGKRILTRTLSRVARVWNADGTGAPVVAEGVDDTVWCPDGERLLLKKGAAARIWRFDDGQSIDLEDHSASLTSLAWSPKGDRVATASEDKTVRIWVPRDTHQESRMTSYDGGVLSAAWSPDGKRIVTASYDRIARIWNADGTGNAVELEGHRHEVKSASWSPDGRRVVTTSVENVVRVWSAGGKGAPTVLGGYGGTVSSAAWSPEGQRIVTASSDNVARVWYVGRAGVPVPLKGHEGAVYAASWSPDGRRIATASDDGTARVWNADGTGVPIVLKGPARAVHNVAWSPDGKRILTVSDNKVRVWSADGAGESVALTGHEGEIRAAAWSPDGKRIVTASYDRTARVWNADGAGEPVILRGHDSFVHSAAWSPDGERIVTASQDGTARVWNADGKGEPGILKGHKGALIAAAWSPDGKRILTASQDGTARVWNADATGTPVVLPVQAAKTSLLGRTSTSGRSAKGGYNLAIPSGILQALRGATEACLFPGLRQTYLDETSSEALAAYEACERSHHRTPFFTFAP